VTIFSTCEERDRISSILSRYLRLPFSADTVPGAIMEGVLAHVLGAERKNTYDFVDVVHAGRGVGWQVKSTKAGTPVTWKRAKIPGAEPLIAASRSSPEACQALGDAIIDFCNQHARESLRRFGLREIGYARLIAYENGDMVYFERSLVTREAPELFDPAAFSWRWSTPKVTKTKEQLPALHGTLKSTGAKWWAAHLLGENQLHFSGERNWWPGDADAHKVTFRAPADSARLSVEDFLAMLEDSVGR